MKVPRFLLVVALAPLIASCLYEAARSITRIVDPGKALWLVYGALAYLPLLPLMLRRDPNGGRPPTLWSMLSSLEHELSHLSTGALVGKRAWKLVVHPKEEEDDKDPSFVRFRQDPELGFWVTLAPYSPPLLALVLLPIELLAPPPYNRFAAAAIGFTLAFRMTGLFRSLHPRQTDLQKMGYVFSYTVVPVIHLVFLIVVLGVVSDRWGELWPALLRGLDRSVGFYARLLELVGQVWRSL